MIVMLGDNIFSDSLVPYVNSYEKQRKGAKVLLKQVSDPCRFGVPVIENDTITAIEEKPVYPKSSYAVTGIYMYDTDVFRIARTLQLSNRGEMEMTDLNNVYIRRGALTYDILDG